MFIDKTKIYVKAGAGGNGAIAFHREKYVAAGGPDGGDGGRGGNIVFQADPNLSTLMDFRYKRKYVAANGVDGQGGRKSGKDGQSLTIRVPRGTLIRDAETGEIIKDMSDDQPFVLCKGGRGGWGNQHFATPTRQVPRFAKAGLPGEEHDVILELKLLADVGLVGFPNVGKSTLVNALLGEERVIAFDMPGTTRDAINIDFEYDGHPFTLVDTAGLRKKGRVFEAIEKFSIVKTLQAIADSNVVVLVIDARSGVAEHDAHIAEYALAIDAVKNLAVFSDEYSEVFAACLEFFNECIADVTRSARDD